MFGKKRRRATEPDNQIPYEVYETLRQPVERRRMFIIRLVAALAVVTLLIFGALALSRRVLHTDQDKKTGGGTAQPVAGPSANPSPSPAPKDQPKETEATPQPESGGSTPGSNTSTVPKPE